jgi:DNA polymerase elongation subunit (family B)
MKFYTSFHQYGSAVLVRGYEFGNRVQKKLRYEPTLYVANYGKYKTDSEKTKYRTLDGTPVSPIKFDSIREARDFIKKYEDVENFKYYGSTNFAYSCINEEYAGQIEHDPSLVAVVCLDIETDSSNGFPNIAQADKAITAITMRRGSSIVALGLKHYTPHAEKITYHRCDGEHELLEKFLELWNSRTYSPDVLTGWNIEGFDLPYIVNRIKRLLGEDRAKELSPWKMLDEREIEINGRLITVGFPIGIAVLDYMRLYKKFSFSNQESYALNFIAEKDLGEKKLDYTEYGSLSEFYERDHQRFMEYNVHDVNLVFKLEDKHRFIEQVMAMAYDAKVNYVDTMATVRPWDTIINNYLLEQKIVIPPTSRPGDQIVDIVGGYVKDPIVGMHEWVVSFDLTSLYPHLIMQYNISPETYRGKMQRQFTVDDAVLGAYDQVREELESKNFTVCPNSSMYSRERQGFFPALMEKMFNDRAKYKKLMIEAKKKFEETKDPEWGKKISAYHNLQLAKKIQLNSAYGALANKYFRWFSVENAEAITTAGQLSIKWIERKINWYLNDLLKTEDRDYVIAIDTDSMYIDMSGLVEHVFAEKRKSTPTAEIVAFLDKACKNKIEPFIAECYDELGVYVNAYQQKMHMKRESIADKGVWTGKKHYVMHVHNEEGVAYSTPKMKMVGIEAVRSSTPKVCRESIKKALTILMTGGKEPLLEFIKEFRTKWNEMSFEEVAFPRGVKLTYFRNIDGRNVPMKYSIDNKSLPIQVRASLVYNQMIAAKNLTNKYKLISDEEKIKFCYLKKPNPCHHNVIASPGDLPTEFGLNEYIDYDLQFDKAFLDPIKSITDVLGWNLDGEVSTLEGFFS